MTIALTDLLPLAPVLITSATAIAVMLTLLSLTSTIIASVMP